MMAQNTNRNLKDDAFAAQGRALATDSKRPGFWMNLSGPESYMGYCDVSPEEFARLFDENNLGKWSPKTLSASSCGLRLTWNRDDANGATIVDNGGRLVAGERDCLEVGESFSWSCAKSVREGDLSLFYRTAPAKDIRYLLLAEKGGIQKEPESRWKFYHGFVVAHKFRNTLPREDVRRVGIYPQGTAFSVTETQWRLLNEMLAERNPSYPDEVRERWGIDIFAGIPSVSAESPVVVPAGLPESSPHERESGAGFGDAESNKEVEDAAMGIARAWYEKRGWKVDDYSKRPGMGYDLHCARNGREKHVEVKGVKGDAEIFHLTPKEKERAFKDDDFVVFVVTSAVSPRPRASRYARAEFVREFNLEADRFKATRRKKG